MLSETFLDNFIMLRIMDIVLWNSIFLMNPLMLFKNFNYDIIISLWYSIFLMNFFEEFLHLINYWLRIKSQGHIYKSIKHSQEYQSWTKHNIVTFLEILQNNFRIILIHPNRHSYNPGNLIPGNHIPGNVIPGNEKIIRIPNVPFKF